MLAILSPAKTLDFESKLTTKKYSEPDFVQESSKLIKSLRQLEPNELSKLMKLSDNLAELNHRRYAEWEPEFSDPVARPAILAFKGDVYLGLDGPTLQPRELTWAQNHVRILSGLHGLLRPLDRIRPYRLEMGTRLKTTAGTNLYEFWGDRVTHALNAALKDQQSKADQNKGKQPTLVNLASNEYFGVLNPDKIDARVITPNFRELRDGKYRFLSFFAKKARGSMARYMIDHRVKTVKSLREFNYDGYSFNASLSSGDNWIFTREATTNN